MSENTTANSERGAKSVTSPAPLVTIILPAYKAERYLPDCIRSVSLQTDSRWLLRVIDDGSPDNCGDMARQFAEADSRISVTRRPNGGLSAARNTGLRDVTTPYVTFLDADDLLLPDYLSSLLQIQQGLPARISCISHFRFADKENLDEILNNYYPEEKRAEKAHPEIKPLIMTPGEAIRNILYQRILDHSAWGKLYPTALVPPGIFTEGIGYEDMDAFYRIFLKASDIAYEPLRLYGYRSNPLSYTNVFTERRADVLDVAERMSAFLSENKPELTAAARSRLLSAFFNIHALASADKTPHPELLQRCRKGIAALRREALTDRNVRMKNKLAAAASYVGGSRLLSLMARLFKGSI